MQKKLIYFPKESCQTRETFATTLMITLENYRLNIKLINCDVQLKIPLKLKERWSVINVKKNTKVIKALYISKFFF